MGWGEPHGKPELQRATESLIRAVRAWRLRPSCNNIEAVCKALDAYDEARLSPGVETGLRTGW